MGGLSLPSGVCAGVAEAEGSSSKISVSSLTVQGFQSSLISWVLLVLARSPGFLPVTRAPHSFVSWYCHTFIFQLASRLQESEWFSGQLMAVPGAGSISFHPKLFITAVWRSAQIWSEEINFSPWWKARHIAEEPMNGGCYCHRHCKVKSATILHLKKTNILEIVIFQSDISSHSYWETKKQITISNI